jgi:hypothetical protein
VVIDVEDSLIIAFSKKILESKVGITCCQLDENNDECLFGRAVALFTSYNEMRRRIQQLIAAAADD